MISINNLFDIFHFVPWMWFDKSAGNNSFETIKKLQQEDKVDEPGLFCKYCHRLITYSSYAMELQGAFTHVFSNPEGITFEIGLYKQADCVDISPPVSEHSWFTGYTWQIVVCAGCRAHLGWHYHSPDSPDFYGLILNRLRQANN